MDLTPSRLWLLTGSQGTGKTSFCRLAAARARLAGWQVSGLLSPAVFSAEKKTGILAEDLRSGESRSLALRSRPGTQPAHFNLPLGEWIFDPAALAWGNQIIEASLPTGLFIIDELGPLEFQHGMGWVAAFSLLPQPRYRVGLVVVRPGLCESACLRLPIHATLDLSTHSSEDSGQLPLEVLASAWWQQAEGESHA